MLDVSAKGLAPIGLYSATARARPGEVRSQTGSWATAAYKFNTDLEIVLEENKTIDLDCEPNPYEMDRYVIYHQVAEDGRDIMGLRTQYDDGTYSLCELPIERFDGILQQLRCTPCLTIVKWQRRDGRLHVVIRASDDLERNQREYRECVLGDRQVYRQYEDRQLIPEVELSEVERLAGFIRAWSEVKFNFAFFDQVPEADWDEILVEYIPKIQKAKTDVEYYRVLRRCVALLHDNHTNIRGPTDERDGQPPIQIRPIQGKAVIVQIYPADKITCQKLRSELLAAALTRGVEVTHVDGRPVQRLLVENIYPYIAASTPQGRELDAYPELVRGPQGTKVKMRIRDLDANERQVCLTRGRYDFGDAQRPFLRELEDGIVSVNLASFGSAKVVKQFEAALERIRAAKGLILDVRENGGGNDASGYAILSMLIDRPVESLRWKTRKYMPAFRAWGRSERWYEGNQGTIKPSDGERYHGPIVALTGPATGSAAEDFVAVLQAAQRGKLVGQRTSGSTGQPLYIDLPGAGSLRICTARTTYPDGREFVGIGVMPDIEVEVTVQDIADRRDVVLERALEVLRSPAT